MRRRLSLIAIRPRHVSAHLSPLSVRVSGDCWTLSHLCDRYAIDMSEQRLADALDEYIPSMMSFLNKYVSSTARSDIKIESVRDIEETIWSPRFVYLPS